MGKHVKSLISVLLAIVMICSMSAVVSAQAETLVDSGSLGNYYSWEYYSNDVLKIYPTSGDVTFLADSDLTNHISEETKLVFDFSRADFGESSEYICFNGFDIQITNITLTGYNVNEINSINISRFSTLRSVCFKEGTSLNTLEVDECDSVLTITNATIEKMIVYKCNGMEALSVPDCVKDLDVEFCDDLKNLTLSGNLESLSLVSLPNLKSLSIPSGLKSFNASEVAITNIYIPKTCEDFYIWHSSLKSATIESGRKSISDYMFYCCSELSSVSIPNSITSIGCDAFSGCSSLTSIVIPDSVNFIDMYAFYNSGIETIAIPSGVSTLEPWTFCNCNNLTSVTLPETLEVLYDVAFLNSNSLTDVYFEGTREQWENIEIPDYEYTIDELFEGITVHFTGSLIETQPEDYTGPIGSTAKFTVVANGEGLKYQWQVLKNGTWTNCSINDGAKKATLSLEAKDSRNGSKYHCIVTDTNGKTETSNEVTLTVVTPLAITTQPEDYSGPVGDYAVFNVSAEGEGLKYQWQVWKSGAWTNCSVNDGAKTDTLTLLIKDSRGGSKYQCVVTDKYGETLTSDEVTLTVKKPLAITSQPTDFSGAPGETAKFIVEAEGDGLKYQWQVWKNGAWTNCSVNDGAKTNTLSLEIKESRNGCRYHCIVSDKSGASVTSDEVTLTSQRSIYIASEPEYYFGSLNEYATFTVEAEGDGLKYQWQVLKNGSWTNCSVNDGAKTDTLTLLIKQSREGSQYRCVITDKYGNIAVTREVNLYIIQIIVEDAVAAAAEAENNVVEVEETVETVEAEETVAVNTVEVVEEVAVEDVAEVS